MSQVKQWRASCAKQDCHPDTRAGAKKWLAIKFCFWEPVSVNYAGVTYPPLALRSHPYGFLKRCETGQHSSFTLLTLHVKPTLAVVVEDKMSPWPLPTTAHRVTVCRTEAEFSLREQLSKHGLQTSSICSTWLLVRTANSCPHLRPQTLGWNPATRILTTGISKHTNVWKIHGLWHLAFFSYLFYFRL